MTSFTLSGTTPGRRIRIDAAIKSYLDHLRARGHSPDTVRLTENLIAAFYRLSGLTADAALVEVTRDIAERVMRGLVAKYSSGTAWAYGAKLVHLFRVFASSGLLLENPFGFVGHPPKSRSLMRTALTWEEMTRLLAAPRVPIPSGVRNRALLELFYSTGLRLRECANLELGDLDLAGGTLLVRGGKGAKDRTLPIGLEAIRWLKRYLAEVRPRYSHGTRALWVGQTGRPMAPVWMRAALRRLGEKARIATRVTPHTLRRTCATHLLSGGASAWVVKELLGHSDGSTLERYLHLEPKDLKEVHEKTHPRS